ncbi:MAG: hypothetical protein CV087_13030 [Candidatus Brocadia sp. WS118]|nr:MAG: hypothetical protein CV087_13030 [Candidatus Brocadia sp. WS118]
MNKMPGFTAETLFYDNAKSYHMAGATGAMAYRGTALHQYSAPLVKAAFPRGRFSTLPTCGEENCRTVVVYEQCGSAPVGEPPPMCPAGTRTECDYVCRWPSGIKGRM